MSVKKLLKACLFTALTVTSGVSPAAFDPVNDDTDIFLANPNIAAVRPNVLIVLDNTANWNTAFANEKAALISVANSLLDDQFNAGLMMFVETGGGNDSVDGAYPKFGIRQMTLANRSAFASMVNALHITADKSNNNVIDLAFYEAYRMFAGKSSRSGFGKVKRDYAGNTVNNPYAASLARNSFASAGATTYSPAITDACQKNFVIYISNGPANENQSSLATAESLLGTISGVTPTQIAISPNGQQANWADEYAKWAANADILPDDVTKPYTIGTQNIITYTLEVDPDTSSSGLAMTALMKSTATNGKGKYFGVTSGGGGSQIVDALKAILVEVQAVNSVFAATTLPVSVNVRGTNLNQVYIGMFRPDSYKGPRWLGGLKMYNLGLDTSTNTVYLADASGARADNQGSGFISANAQSFWTSPSTFWGFRSASENGVGGASDSPDGDLVEKGGVAQQLRLSYATDQSTRKLYSCTGPCAPGDTLSTYPFATSNADITPAALNLSAIQVSTLSGLSSKNVTELTDRLPASLNNSTLPVTVTALTNGATSLAVSSLTTAVPQTVTSIDARVTGSGTVNLNNVQKISGTFVVTTTIAHGFSNGASVVISGNSVSAYNGTWTISSVTATTFIIGASGNPGTGTGGTATGPAVVNSTTAKVTMPLAHGFASGQQVTISGAAPVAFNGTFSINVLSTTQFTYIISSAQGLATGSIFAAGNTNVATVTTSVAHGLTAGASINIIGANPTAYNGAFTVTDCGSGQTPAACTGTSTTARYSVTGTPSPNSASGVTLVKGGSTTATATTAVAHAFSTGQQVQIQGASPAAWNGTYTLTAAVPGTTTFTFTRASILGDASGTITASTGTGSLVTATVTNHGLVGGQSFIVAGANEAGHNGTFTVAKWINANTFTYCTNGGSYIGGIPAACTGTGLPAPTGSTTVRPVTGKAYVTVPSHGYSTGQSVIIAGANPTAFNGTFTITVIDTNNFTYVPSTTPSGPNTSLAVTASVPTTTARAVAFNHGFSSGLTITVSGATPSAFNGAQTITVIDANTFTYTLGSAQGDATGAIVAASSGSASVSLRDAVINWVRGQDNLDDENANGSSTDIRASVHGDVLHSRPAVVNYGRRTGVNADSDVYVFYGSNDGIFRSIKGGFTSAAGDPAVGTEIWGFIPPEFFPNLARLRNNAPPISSNNKKPYFADGLVGVYTLDNNNDGKIDVTVDANDKAWLFVSMRRGDRLIYALDVSNPLVPKLLWKRDESSPGFGELGYTWSEPKVVRQVNGHTGPVLVFGAGYDPTVEDRDPASITSSTATTVTTTAGTFTRTMGRGIYIVDATTGDIVWAAGSQAAPTGLPAGAVYVQVPDMICSIPSDITVLRNKGGATVNRGYVGDTCGNLWRLDFSSGTTAGWRVTKLASVASATPASERRKFLFAPDVVYGQGYDAILVGSGDREHPFGTTVVNRMYMFKDYGIGTTPVTGNVSTLPALSPAGTIATITESALYDATTNCIQEASGCASGVTSAIAETQLASSSGWYITLATGEKSVGGAVTLAGTTFFNTNQPSASAGGGTCGSNLGIARQYQVNFADATAVNDLAPGGGLTTGDRSVVYAGGGYLPSPVPVMVQIGGTTVQAVISGVSVQQAPGATLQSRLRKFWYKEIE